MIYNCRNIFRECRMTLGEDIYLVPIWIS